MEITATDLRHLLSKYIVNFTYRKTNGEIRKAVGTRNLSLAQRRTGTEIPVPKGESNPNAYFDIEKMAWRSYRPENLVSIESWDGRPNPQEETSNN